MADNDSAPPCEQFTVVDSRKNKKWPQCDVCDQHESAHEAPGRRVLSGGEIEALRRRIIIERFDLREKEQPDPHGQFDLGTGTDGHAQDVIEIDDRPPT